ncbi:hypothetical protein P7G97_06470 [Enterococcus canintestini]|nr:hypothetical protein [Enterococcus sp. MJM12]MDT2739580.1 hypothetical protein [Enterococcus canintestini]
MRTLTFLTLWWKKLSGIADRIAKYNQLGEVAEYKGVNAFYNLKNK